MATPDEVLKERAVRLAAKEEEETKEQDLLHLLEFQLGHERYGIEVHFVKEVCPFSACTQLPHTPDFVLGVVNIRQRIVSVLDLKKILSIGECERAASPKVIVVEKDDLEFALLVDEVRGQKRVPLASILPPPLSLQGMQRDLLKGMTLDKLILLEGAALFMKKELIVNRS